MGWRNKKAKYSSSAFKIMQQERMKQAEIRERERRLTEIDSRRMTSPRRRQVQKRSTWDVRRIGGGSFFGRRRGRTGGPADVV